MFSSVNIYAIFMRYILHLADLMTPEGVDEQRNVCFLLGIDC